MEKERKEEETETTTKGTGPVLLSSLVLRYAATGIRGKTCAKKYDNDILRRPASGFCSLGKISCRSVVRVSFATVTIGTQKVWRIYAVKVRADLDVMWSLFQRDLLWRVDDNKLLCSEI